MPPILLLLGLGAMVAYALSQQKSGGKPPQGKLPPPPPPIDGSPSYPGGVPIKPGGTIPIKPGTTPGTVVTRPRIPGLDLVTTTPGGVSAYTVMGADTPQSIAAKFGMDVNTLLANNGIRQTLLDMPAFEFKLGGMTFTPNGRLDSRGLPIYITDNPAHRFVVWPGASIGLPPIQWGRYEDVVSPGDGLLITFNETQNIIVTPWATGMELKVPKRTVGSPGPAAGR